MPGPGTWSAGDVLEAADLNAIGTWTSYTPTLDQNGTRTATVNFAEYCQINKMCTAIVDLTCTTTGSASNIITVSLPVNLTSSFSVGPLGSGIVFDASANDVILVTVIRESNSTVRFLAENSTSRNSGIGANPALTLANGDIISFSVSYPTV